MTEEFLKELFKHSLVLKVWDTKEKMSTRARFDRPKAFRLPHAKPGQFWSPFLLKLRFATIAKSHLGEDADNAGGVKGLVMKQCRNYEKLQPKKSYIDRPLPGQSRGPDYVPLAHGMFSCRLTWIFSTYSLFIPLLCQDAMRFFYSHNHSAVMITNCML
jgi:hypothetical protein